MIQFDYTLAIVLMGTTLVGITSGIIGCFIILQRKSLLADALAHATLPGVAIMFLYANNHSSALLLLSAMISALFGAWTIRLINQHTSLKKETALGIVLSSTFGFGTVLLSIIQTLPIAHKSCIHKFLLGNASTFLTHDLIMIGINTIIIIAITICCWKEFKIFIFNKEFAHAIGMQIGIIELILTLITILTIITGLQTVGVVLISSLLIAPATTALQWTTSFSHMILLSCLCSCIATISGTLISSSMPHLPTGPVIIIIATCFTLFSILCAPYIKSKTMRVMHD